MKSSVTARDIPLTKAEVRANNKRKDTELHNGWIENARQEKRGNIT